MAFYENTIIAKQDLAETELNSLKNKYNDLIKNSSGKVVKIEEWGLLKLASKVKKYKKGFYIHYKFEGNNKTLIEIEKKMKLDTSIIRHLTVKYKKLDVENEFFKSKSK
jgi:small subunit ribosomal protein S6|tara:strand:- start:2057 stop:2383 length:327 start_codon:yes stop_codon:yes gene_type:complete